MGFGFDCLFVVCLLRCYLVGFVISNWLASSYVLGWLLLFGFLIVVVPVVWFCILYYFVVCLLFFNYYFDGV